MDLNPKLSSLLFRLVGQLEHWVSLPESVSEALEYRHSYRNFLPTSPRDSSQKRPLWIHGASVGELEDLAAFFLSRDLLKQSGLTTSDIILTSSSPSALGRLEKWNKEFEFLYAGPLPPEDEDSIQLFLKTLNPQSLLMSHTDYWPLLFQRASQLQDFHFFWYPEIGRFGSQSFRKFLNHTAHTVFLRSPAVQFPNAKCIGHPRIERILNRVQDASKRVEHVLSPLQCSPVPNHINLIFGSAWPEDLVFFKETFRKLPPEFQKRFHLVVVPHDLKAHNVAQMKSILPEAHFVLKQGLLLESYRAFDVAWVGGGFRTGLHNILEPILWGVPTLCGPKTRKQAFATQMENEGYLWILRSENDLKRFLFETETPKVVQHKGKIPNLDFHLSANKKLADMIQGSFSKTT